MTLIIKNKQHYFTRLPIGIAFIVIIGFLPLIIGIIGANITEWTTGEPCHEGNCFWGTIPWLTFYTVPIAALAMLVYLVIVVIDVTKLRKAE